MPSAAAPSESPLRLANISITSVAAVEMPTSLPLSIAWNT
jgi:hypothetical protein